MSDLPDEAWFRERGMPGLPTRIVIRSFERGHSPASIADGFGLEATAIVELLVEVRRREGRSDEDIAEELGEHWLGR